ncbi:hypothetical protein YC2023_110715 [Brassica napus]
MSPFHNRSERFGKFLCLIFFLFDDLQVFKYGFDIHIFRSGSDFGKLMRSLLGSLLKYNALEDFQKVSPNDFKKSSRRLSRRLLTESSSISSGV